MKEDLYDDLYEEKEEKIDFHAMLFRYIIRWPWFVASIILCLAGAWLYLRQTTPVYNISASVVIKDDKKGGNSGGNLTALEGLGLVSSVSNIDNEIEILRSKTLVKHVVSELNLYTTYTAKGSFNETELYKNSPVLVGLTPQEADKLAAPAVFELILSPGNRLDVKATIGESSYSKSSPSCRPCSLLPQARSRLRLPTTPSPSKNRRRSPPLSAIPCGQPKAMREHSV